MSLKKSASAGMFWNVSVQGFNQLVSFFVYMLLARLLEVEDFGLVAFSFLIIEFSSIFMSIGINQNLIQRKQWSDEFASSTFCLILIISAFLTLILVVFVAPIIYYFYSELGALIVLALSITPVVNGMRITQESKLQREFQNKKIAGIESVSILVSGSLSVLLALNGFAVWSIVIGRIVQSLLNTLLIWMKSEFRPKFTFVSSHFEEIKAFSIPLLTMAILTFFSGKTMNLVTGLFLGPALFAYVTIARRPFNILLSLSMQQLNKITLATVSRVEDKQVSSTYYRIVALTAFIVIPLYIGLGSVAGPFIAFSLGGKWEQSIVLMYIVSLAAPAFIMSWYLPTLLISRGHTKSALKINIYVCFSNIVFPLLAVNWGVEAVCLSILISAYITLPIRFNIAGEHLDVALYPALKSILPFVISGLMMFAGTIYIDKRDWLSFGNVFSELILLVATGGVIYVLFLSVFFKRRLLLVIDEIKKLKE